jgi:hypothetical protein
VAYIQSWQYRVFDAEPDDDNFENELNRLGNSGWEICGIFPQDDIILFKRPTDGIRPYTGAETRRKRPERREREVQ